MTTRERLELPDGDFVDLDFAGDNSSALVCLFHGLEGSIDSPYIRATISALVDNGLRCVLMHFRGCSGEPNRKIHSYHSGHTDDIRFLLSTLRQRQPQTRLIAVGFSLGANALLKYQGEEGENSPLNLALAVSPPFVLSAGAKRMNRGFSRIYQQHLIDAMNTSLRRKIEVMPGFPINAESLSQLTNFWQFDDEITARLNGFDDVHDYYEKSSCKQYLSSIKNTTHIIHACDDPFFDTAMIPSDSDLSEAVTLELARYGGHVGFVSGSVPGKAEYWLDGRIAELVKLHR